MASLTLSKAFRCFRNARRNLRETQRLQIGAERIWIGIQNFSPFYRTFYKMKTSNHCRIFPKQCRAREPLFI